MSRANEPARVYPMNKVFKSLYAEYLNVRKCASTLESAGIRVVKAIHFLLFLS